LGKADLCRPALNRRLLSIADIRACDNGFSASTSVKVPPPGPQQIPPGPSTIPIFLGPVGPIFEQVARLSVVAYPPNPCTGTIGFVDTTGKVIVPLTPVTLAPNQAISLDVAGFQAGTALGSSRPEVIGVFTPTATTAAPPGVCIPSLEVFDRVTGYTRVLIPPGPTNIPPGQPPCQMAHRPDASRW
jgi:hypothetical protein